MAFHTSKQCERKFITHTRHAWRELIRYKQVCAHMGKLDGVSWAFRVKRGWTRNMFPFLGDLNFLLMSKEKTHTCKGFLINLSNVVPKGKCRKDFKRSQWSNIKKELRPFVKTFQIYENITAKYTTITIYSNNY